MRWSCRHPKIVQGKPWVDGLQNLNHLNVQPVGLFVVGHNRVHMDDRITLKAFLQLHLNQVYCVVHMHDVRIARHLCMQRNHTAAPVSYTHLDVYKRQPTYVTLAEVADLQAYIEQTGALYLDAAGISHAGDVGTDDGYVVYSGNKAAFEQIQDILSAFSKPCLLYTSRCV